MMTWTSILTAMATGVSGILAGASLDQSIKQLPARRRMGAVAFSHYTKAGDLANGVPWYATLGGLALVTTLAAAIVAWVKTGASLRNDALLAAAVLVVAHSLVTAKAAPINHSLRRAGDDPARVTGILDRFARWQGLRCVLQVLAFLALLAADLPS